jgi:aspartyl/glutamyl-tRNA(Asn/Gln) amidotransferase C subunit
MISREEIQNLAELSRLKLSDKEAEDLQKDFDSILEYVGQVQAVAKDDQGPTFSSYSSPLALQDSSRSDLSLPELINVMRDDVPRAADDILAGKQEAMLAQTPKREGDYVAVRKIIDREN